ncbi:hypothetical protein NCS52_01535700 [Fusarium sp. LHS14.1]|nr:hypothetical protein NCS52_01535700 [Fusarium sp. LHS14.1]
MLTTIDHDRENCSPWRTKMIAYDTLPEVQEYSVIMQSIYRDYCLRKLKEFLGKAESSLRQAIVFKLNENLDKEYPQSAEQGFTLIDVSYEGILRKLRTINFLSDSLHQALEHRIEK